jgi:FixH
LEPVSSYFLQSGPWGLFILLSFPLSKNNDLVAVDYYNREIAFQSQIDKEKNARKLSRPLTLNFDREVNFIVLHFPDDFHSKSVSGKIHFFKPDNAALRF